MATVTFAGTKYKMVEDFTWREMSELKRIAGVLPADLNKALEGGDPDVMVALAYVSIRRVNVALTLDALYDSPTDGGIVIDADPPEPDAAPLVSPEVGAAEETAIVQ